MSVGETLTEARLRAGLTVDELSERTRIRETVIRCIEQDDYDACGGDVFVRGYVRALASAIGIDAQPLIRAYDRGRTDTSGDTFAHVARVAAPVPAVDPGPGPRPGADPDVTSADLPPVSADPAVTAFDIPVVTEDPTPTVADLPVIAAEPAGLGGSAGTPAGPAGQGGSPPPSSPLPPAPGRGDLPGDWTPARQRTPAPRRNGSQRRRRVARIAVPAALLLAVAGVATGLAVSSQPAAAGKNTASVTRPSTHAAHAPLSAQSAKAGTSATPAPAPAPATTAPTAPTTPAPTQPVAPVTSLHIASVAAFGPGGLADGDNPQIAARVLSDPATGWMSQWYATPGFGGLKQGTGLLLDLGRTVTITSVRIELASYQGASLQLRTGDTAGALSGLKVAATASDVGGTVQLSLRTPEQARYVLIWFTMLPPNGAGQYQAAVYHVAVNGRALPAMTRARTAGGTATWTR